MTLPPPAVLVPKVQVPSLVARLPLVPGIKVDPSAERPEEPVDGCAVGSALADQFELVHSYQLPWALSAKTWPLSTTSFAAAPSVAGCPLSRMTLPPPAVPVPKVQVPSLVTRLPLAPGVKVDPSADGAAAGRGGGG